MELNPKAIQGLRLIGDSTLIKDPDFEEFTNFTFKCIVEKEASTSKDFSRFKGDPASLKLAHYALCTLIVEAAKHNCDETNISPILEECSMSSDRIDSFNKTFQLYKADLRMLLASTGFHPDHIVDVDWRLDFKMKSKQLDSLNEPQFTVVLKTEQFGADELSDFQFNCSQEQLQDLVGKLKDACKSIERSTQINP